MSDEVSVGELKRRVERLERKEISSYAFEAIIKNNERRMEQIEDSHKWTLRFLVTTSAMVVLHITVTLLSELI